LVCDVKNIENIFHHKYGEKTDFNGYMNKYFSSKPFEYDNKAAINSFLEEIYRKVNNDGFEIPQNIGHIQLLNTLQKADQLSLREVLKILQNDFNEFNLDRNRNNNLYLLIKGKFSKSIGFLIEVLGEDTLRAKIEKLISKKYIEKNDYFEDSKNILASLGMVIQNEQNIIVSEYNETKFTLEYNEFRMSEIINKVDIKQINSLEPHKVGFKNFENIDFYKMIIQFVNKYQFSLKNAQL